MIKIVPQTPADQREAEEAAEILMWACWVRKLLHYSDGTILMQKAEGLELEQLKRMRAKIQQGQ